MGRLKVCGEITKVEKSDQVGGEVVVNVYAENLKNGPTIKPPPMKKSRLHYEAIIMGEMLSDIHINMAQSDCGVFSIANATTIAFGLSPAKQTLQQDHMRAHLVSCLQKKEFSLFSFM